MSLPGQVSPVIRYVRSLGEYLTLAEVARVLRLPEETLRYWRKRYPEAFSPSEMTHFGSLPIYLYSLEDLERVREAADLRRSPRGRPRMWSTAEATDRRRRGIIARQQEARARRCRERGEPTGAKEAAGRACELRSGLRSESDERRRRLGLAVS